MDYSKFTKDELIKIIHDFENENLARSRDLFISNISHDVRTLLNAIYGNAQILDSDDTLNIEQKKSVKRIIEASSHMIDLINNIISISKNSGEDKLVLSQFNLCELLDNIYNVFRNIANSKGLIFEVNSNIPKDYLLKTDKNKLFYILLNLVGNAFKYTAAGIIKINCILNEKQNKILFEVTDTGLGIDKNVIESISQNYVRGENSKGTEGFGLGLGIVNKNLSLLESTLEIKSDVKRGSVFSFFIKCKKNSIPFESTQNDIFEIKQIEKIKDPNNFIVLLYLKDKSKIEVLHNYFTNREITYKIIETIDDLKVNLNIDKNKMIFINSSKLIKNEIEFFKEFKKDNSLTPLISLTSSVMSDELIQINKISNTYLIEPYSFSDIDQALIIFSKEEFLFESKSNDEIENNVLIVENNLIKDIINEASLGNYKSCSDLINLIEDNNSKKILLDYLENYDFDKIMKILIKSEDNHGNI